MSASEHRLYFLLQLAARQLKTRADSVLLNAGGLTTSQAAAMLIIAEEGTTTQKFVADRLAQRESAVATMANRLLEAGYIKRTKSRADGRAWNLQPTRKGLAALGDLKDSFGEINRLLDETFSAKEIENLASRLHKIIADLDS